MISCNVRLFSPLSSLTFFCPYYMLNRWAHWLCVLASRFYASTDVWQYSPRGFHHRWPHTFSCRMIADPSFLYKLCLEQVATVGYSVWWELKNRKGRCVLISTMLTFLRWSRRVDFLHERYPMGSAGSRRSGISPWSTSWRSPPATPWWSGRSRPATPTPTPSSSSGRTPWTSSPTTSLRRTTCSASLTSRSGFNPSSTRRRGSPSPGWPPEWPRAPSPTTLPGRRRGGKVNHPKWAARAAFSSRSTEDRSRDAAWIPSHPLHFWQCPQVVGHRSQREHQRSWLWSLLGALCQPPVSAPERPRQGGLQPLWCARSCPVLQHRPQVSPPRWLPPPLGLFSGPGAGRLLSSFFPN